MAGKDILSMILQGGATAAGAVVGGPAGAAVGAGAGQAVSAGIDMLTDKPQWPGPSADEKMALFFAGENAAEASMTDSASPQSVARLQEASGKAGMQQANELNTVALGMSPLDRSRLTTSLLSRSSESRAKGQSALEGYIEGSRGRALVNKVQANSAYATQAKSVNLARQLRVLRMQQAENGLNDQFAGIMKNLVTSMANPALNMFQLGGEGSTASGKGSVGGYTSGAGVKAGGSLLEGTDALSNSEFVPNKDVVPAVTPEGLDYSLDFGADVKPQLNPKDVGSGWDFDNMSENEMFGYMERMFGRGAL